MFQYNNYLKQKYFLRLVVGPWKVKTNNMN